MCKIGKGIEFSSFILQKQGRNLQKWCQTMLKITQLYSPICVKEETGLC